MFDRSCITPIEVRTTAPCSCRGAARFRSVDDAVAWAFGYPPVCKVSNAVANLRGGSVRLKVERRDPYDNAAEAGLILRIVFRELKPDELVMVVGRHTVDSTTQKLDCVARILELARPQFARVPWAYFRECVAAWCRLAQMRSDLRWADALDVDPRTIRSWRRGYRARGRRSPGIWSELDRRLQCAYDQVSPALADAGWIEGTS